VLWLSQFHRAFHNLKHRFEVEIEEAQERNVHGFKGYRLKQTQLAMLWSAPVSRSNIPLGLSVLTVSEKNTDCTGRPSSWSESS
jgi:hypothetical protein